MLEQFEKNLASKLSHSTFYATPKNGEDLTAEEGRALTEESFLALEDVDTIQDFDVPSNPRPSR